ncbi:MAG: ATP-binding protein [Bacteroidota bacterium]|nr:ATP-binding protein [Bacteroidota bacterium]
METTRFQKLDLWAERLVSFPGCDQKTLNIRKTMWIATVFGQVHVILHTAAFLIFAPQSLHLLINYGYKLLIIIGFTLFVAPKLIRGFNLYFVSYLTVLLLLTFYTILKLGGIATSCGLIFACLAFVLSSVPLQNKKITAFLFLIFTIIVVLSGLLVPWLTVPKEITPRINAIVFVMNTLSMSLLIFYLTISFFSQQSHVEKLEADKLKELNEAKNKLFTNITHEFRTPLTVIQGMTELIEKNPEEWLGEGTQKIRNNSHILLSLVNQMLDLSKIETGVMPVHRVQSDICAYIGYIAGLFRSVADSRRIRLVAETSGEKFMMDFDADKLLHILSNLISNALKFTPEGGLVSVVAFPDEAKKMFTLRVEDNGIGINSDHLPHIFDRFYKVENNSGNPDGTGLGLALSKELTGLLGGTISAESLPGKGTTIFVSLPVTRDAALEELSGITPFKTPSEIKKNSTHEKHPVQATDNTLPVLLIVEDSRDVADYLTVILKNEYRIEWAENGKSGFERALNLIPDIVLSDVMMPEMDGIELLGKLKNDIRTSHIPVVILTAKADVASRLSGLESGADAYLAKPFDEKELHIVLKNLIGIRKKLHERYASPDKFPPLPENGYKIEDAFMEKVRHVLEANLDDDEFGITQLCRELAVSRTQLYRKFKSVSNQSIADYFKLLRLFKSKSLLSTTKMNVTEVAFASGFKNLSYFSREFTHQFGKSPKEFRN